MILNYEVRFIIQHDTKTTTESSIEHMNKPTQKENVRTRAIDAPIPALSAVNRSLWSAPVKHGTDSVPHKVIAPGYQFSYRLRMSRIVKMLHNFESEVSGTLFSLSHRLQLSTKIHLQGAQFLRPVFTKELQVAAMRCVS